MSTSETQVRDGGSSFEIARSASYNHLPQLASIGDSVDFKRTISEINLTRLSADSNNTPHEDEIKTGKEILRRSSLRSSTRDRKKSNEAPPVPKLPRANTSTPPSKKPTKPVPSPEDGNKASKSGSLSSLTLRSWISSKASTSNRLQKSSAPENPQQQAPLPEKPREITSSATSDTNMDRDVRGLDGAESSKPGRLSTKLNRRPSSAVAPKVNTDSDTKAQKLSSRQSLRRRPSLERIAASVGLSKKDVPPVPQNPVVQQPQRRADSPKKKDELWAVFRSIDVDYQKFISKSTPLKVNVLRSSLLPCLARYANHPSNRCLRPEDLDRRTNILNKWWKALLDILNSRNGQTLTGIDRPVYLEAIVSIMDRPEWRVPNSPRSSPTTPTVLKSDLSRKSNTSLESVGSDFLIDSIHHNVRNTFNQNLLSQLAYAIDRLSVRHTPASLVSFCGKTCAYAFFFCPQVADVLVRLWSIPPGTLRRVVNEFDAVHTPAVRTAISDEVSAHFPPGVRSLCFSTHSSLVRYLRRNVPVPLAASRINWFGPWTSRWAGRDTDLLFIFFKHFYILVSECLPADTHQSKRVYIPGLVPVHAQMLTVLENTLNKQNGLQSSDSLQNTASVTFDDLIDTADATATSLPLRATNPLRLMSESRLIQILRDILGDTSLQPSTKQMYMESFCGILKLSARKISLYDNSACFSLCDFVEELITVISPYCRTTNQPDALDWDFWLDVCDQMMKSNNALTEVRAFSFIFTTWEEINHDIQRKNRLCLEMLLHEKLFYRYFAHWSPMVRAYFHRLVCWRLARYDGDQPAADTHIYQALFDRLGKVWSYFLYQQSQAERNLSVSLSTAPCTPAPGRRIIIIRSDYYPQNTGMLGSFDNMIPPSLVGNPLSDNELGGLKGADKKADISPEAPPPQTKKSWKFFRTMFKSSSNPRPGEVTPPGSSGGSESTDQSSETTPAPTTESQDSNDETGETNNSSSASESSNKSQRLFTFRFCLEWTDRQKWPNKNRQLYPPSLPAPARLYIHSSRKPTVNQSDSGSASMSNSVHTADDGSETNSIGESFINQPTSTDAGLPKNNDMQAMTPTPGNWVSATSKYAGRALAEWAMIVSECDNFFERRRDEGVTCDKMVEIPTLGVDSFRK